MSATTAWAWADAPGVAGEDGAQIRVLRPDDPARARRWTEVLRGYAADGARSPLPSAGADDWVLALGAEASAAAGELARRLGRQAGCVREAADF
ncbi:MAG TPA: hypothetical protein VLK84_21030, partial [Longimicrobium sp.]|nr:hypothetical protein [Longimicrobium sp.]